MENILSAGTVPSQVFWAVRQFWGHPCRVISTTIPLRRFSARGLWLGATFCSNGQKPGIRLPVVIGGARFVTINNWQTNILGSLLLTKTQTFQTVLAGLFSKVGFFYSVVKTQTFGESPARNKTQQTRALWLSEGILRLPTGRQFLSCYNSFVQGKEKLVIFETTHCFKGLNGAANHTQTQQSPGWGNVNFNQFRKVFRISHVSLPTTCYFRCKPS